MMLSCREASRLMSDAMDRKLRHHEQLSLRFHLLLCQNCRHVLLQMATLRAGIREGRQR